jgi:uncharacterized protein with HEPN domain
MIDARLPLLLDSLLQAANDAVRFTADLSAEDFSADDLIQSAVMMCFIRMGEFVGKIGQRSPQFVADHADWPWAEIRAVRNIASHIYDDLDFARVWSIVRDDLPALIDKINALGPLDPRPDPTP